MFGLFKKKKDKDKSTPASPSAAASSASAVSQPSVAEVSSAPVAVQQPVESQASLVAAQNFQPEQSAGNEAKPSSFEPILDPQPPVVGLYLREDGDIDYQASGVVDFIELLDTCCNFSSLQAGSSQLQQIQETLDAERFSRLYARAQGSVELATVLLTLQAGKLFLVENGEDREFTTTYAQVVQRLQLGGHANSSPVMASSASGNDLAAQASEQEMKSGASTPGSSTPSSPSRSSSMLSLADATQRMSLSSGSLRSPEARNSNNRKTFSSPIIQLDASPSSASSKALPDSGKKSRGEVVEAAAAVERDRQQLKSVLLLSILYASVHFTFDRCNPSLLSVFDAWNLVLADDSNAALVRKFVDEPAEDFWAEVIDQVSNCFSNSGTQETPDADPINVESVSTMAPAIMYHYLQSRYREHAEDRQSILELLTLRIMQADLPGWRLLSFLHMAASLLPLASNYSSGTLRDLGNVIKLHIVKPNPFSAAVSELLMMIDREIRCAGHLMRQRFESSTRTVVDASSPSTPAATKRRVVHLFANPTHRGSSMLVHRLYLGNQVDAFECTPQDAQSALLIDIYRNNITADPQDELASLSSSQLAPFYKEARAIVERVLNPLAASPSASKSVPQELSELRIRILAAAASSGKKVTVFRKPVMMKHPTREVQLHAPELRDSLVQPVAQRVSKTLPRSIHYGTLEEICRNAKQETPAGSTAIVEVCVAGGGGTLHHVIVALTVLRAKEAALMQNVEVRLTVLPVHFSSNGLSTFQQLFDGWYAVHVAVPALSLLAPLPSIQCNTSGVMIPAPKYLRSSVMVEPAALVASRRKATISSSAMKAGSPVVSPPRAPMADGSGPSVSVDARGFDEKAYGIPHRFYRRVLENMYSEARNLSKLRLFQCQCSRFEVTLRETRAPDGSLKKEKSTQLKDVLMLPFCLSAEIGINTESTSFRKSEGLDSSLADIQQLKSFKYNPRVLKISYTYMTVAGSEIKKEMDEEERMYQSIALKNVSRPGADRSTPLAVPTTNWLEAGIVEMDSKKKRPRPDLRVASFRVETPDYEDFDVMLDGEVYGPFQKIRIVPWKFPTEEFGSVQIAHSLPLDL